jgi:hypothetical protein
MTFWSIFDINDTLYSLAAVFFFNTWIFFPRKIEYKNIFLAWLVFLISELFIMSIFAALFLSKIIPDVSSPLFDTIYWILIGLTYCALVQATRTSLEKKVILYPAGRDYWQEVAKMRPQKVAAKSEKRKVIKSRR